MHVTQESINLLFGDLELIKWLLAAILAVFAVAVAGLAYGLVMLARTADRVAEQRNLNVFRNEADELLERDDLDALIRFAKGKLTTHPRHTYAHWYLALAYYHKGMLHDSLGEFTEVSNLEPTWREDHVDPYVEEIRERMKNTSPELVKS